MKYGAVIHSDEELKLETSVFYDVYLIDLVVDNVLFVRKLY